jgi:NTP pyrophosphatase (non-canonical NTP hydrolase)
VTGHAIEELQERLRIFRDARDWEQFHTLKDLAAAVQIEAGELQELFLWSTDDACVLREKRPEVEAELSDVLIQCLNFALAAEIDVGAAIEAKIDDSSPDTLGPLADGQHTFTVRATDSTGNVDPSPASRTFTVDVSPPQTTINSGPSGPTNDPTPTFTFSSSETGSFQCRVDSGAYAACSSPKTTASLTDGSHTFSVRATDPAGNPDPSPATRTFTVRTAAFSISGTTLVVAAATGAKDNLAITRPSASVVRVTDLPSGTYTGSGVHTGAGCTRTGDYTANCSGEIAQIRVTAGDQIDQIVNSTAVQSSIFGGAANDALIGGPGKDSLTGDAGADVMKGMNGNDQLFARDLTSDTTINCDGGIGTPGSADKADLDLLPKDPNSVVTGCETQTRH